MFSTAMLFNLKIFSNIIRVSRLLFFLGIVVVMCIYSLRFGSSFDQESNTTNAWQNANLDIQEVYSEFLNLTNIPRPPKNYLVWSDQCRIVKVDPFTVDSKKIFHPLKYFNCSTEVPLTTVTFDQNLRRYILHTNTDLTKNLSCCYQEIKRGSNDDAIKLLPCLDIPQDFPVPSYIDGMIVVCKSGGKKGEVIHRDAHFFIQERKRTEVSSPRALSVFMIGIDSLSKFNLRRNMPKTVELLQRTNWIEMEGYNKMGDNTFPNLMALLTGFNATRAHDKCEPKKEGGLDKCPFIWKQYKEQGYLTAYAEDMSYMSTFNYLKKGFKNPPVDYYIRPFLLATEKNLKTKKSKNGCIGLKHAAEYIYDYGLEFATRYLKKPTFGLFWANSFSHESFELSSAFDKRMETYLQQFEERGIFENSIVIFLSDHGMRFGPLRKLRQGFLEERLPLLFIHLPNWFRQRHPEIVYALEVNRNRLTNPYDLHNTLQHILEISTLKKLSFTGSEGCPNCQTIFRQVPRNRSCSEINIDNHWCSCLSLKSVNVKTKELKFIANSIIEKMNAFLRKNSLLTHCETLQLKSIVAANRMDVPFSNDQIHYVINFIASPSKPEFEALAVFDTKSNSTDVKDITSVSRLNWYASDSSCISHIIAKKFCICRKNSS